MVKGYVQSIEHRLIECAVLFTLPLHLAMNITSTYYITPTMLQKPYKIRVAFNFTLTLKLALIVLNVDHIFLCH